MGIRPVCLLFAVVVFAGFAHVDPRAASLSASDAAIYDSAFKAADNGNWASAMQLAGSASDKTLRDVVMWRYVRTPLVDGPGVQTRVEFLKGHGDWPLSNAIRRQIEDQLLIEPHSASEVVEILTRFSPVSVNGKRALGQAYLSQGRPQEATRLFREAWVDGNFSKENEDKFLGVAAPYLRSADHVARTDRLIWDGVYDSAQRMISRLPRDEGLLMQARISLGSGSGNASAAVNAVPAHLKNDPGLVFERVRWRRKKDLTDDAISLLNTVKARGGHEALWWREQNILTREALERGHVTQAYRLAANHNHQPGTQATEAEFLAGWIALRFLHDPKTALGHFSKLYRDVEMPISLSRGAYWNGRAEEALGNSASAREWYQRASRHPTTFYGQLAAARISVPLASLLKTDAQATQSALSKNPLAGDKMMKVATQLAALRRHDELISFLLVLSDNNPDENVQRVLAHLGMTSGRPDYAVQVARRAARHNVVLLENGYPLPNSIRGAVTQQVRANGFRESVSYGIMRQESNFNTGARSSAGALGLMQLMPATAQAMAKKEGVAFSQPSLTGDPSYNTRLGNRYLGDLLTRFDGSLVLAAAGYNAGPGRPSRWMGERGDPRVMKADDIVDWIEGIPFNETRNYVMRVVEGAMVYRVRLGDAPDAKASETFLRNVNR